MEDIIISLQPAFHRVERFILWKNRYVSLLAFIIGHCIFYAMARAGLRPFCAMILVVLIFHILDCLKQKRSSSLAINEEEDLCELTQLILRSYRQLCQTHEKLNTLKTENRVKYSVLIIISCLILAYIGVKINGFYVSYLIMLILFTLPAIMYHKLIPKLIQRVAPVLEQLDQSMEYKRRSLVNRKDLLVNINKSGGKHDDDDDDDDDDDLRRLKQSHQQLQQEQTQTKHHLSNSSDDDDDDDDKENEQKLMDTNDRSQTILDFRQRYQNAPNTNDAAVVPKHTKMGDSSFDMLGDSTSSITDDEATRISELYASVGDQIDGKHRIKIKGDELKIKGHSTRQRPKLMDAPFFQLNKDDNNSNTNKPSPPILINTSLVNSTGEPDLTSFDLTSFDFLNDYEEKP